jgi:hypothetical protein
VGTDQRNRLANCHFAGCDVNRATKAPLGHGRSRRQHSDAQKTSKWQNCVSPHQ